MPSKATILFSFLALSPLLFARQWIKLKSWTIQEASTQQSSSSSSSFQLDLAPDLQASIRVARSKVLKAKQEEAVPGSTTPAPTPRNPGHYTSPKEERRQRKELEKKNHRKKERQAAKKGPKKVRQNPKANTTTQSSSVQLQVNLPSITFDPAQQRTFYQNHQLWMLRLFQDNTDNFMVWDVRSQPLEMELFWKEFDPQQIFNALDVEAQKIPYNRSRPYIYFHGACEAAQYFAQQRVHTPNTPMPHVAFLCLNENWGAFSETIPNKTIDWTKNLTEHWEKRGCTVQFIRDYLNHPDTLLAVTLQFQFWDLYPKLISLPLGVKSLEEARELQRHALLATTTDNTNHRPQLLMVNCNPGPTRDATLAAVLKNFPGSRNTYDPRWRDKTQYYQEIQRSKFVLAPGGLGLDCYRIWEALLVGTIPIVETLNRTDGWFHTLDELPVAFIDSFEQLTPEWLETEYQRILAGDYNYRKLTKQYWIRWIKSHVENSTSTTTTTTTVA